MVHFGIVDYGMGNLRSVLGAVEKIGHRGTISSDAGTLEACDRLILPGVGAFGDAMVNVEARGLRSIMEVILLDTMFELPGMTGIEEVVINSEVVEGRAKPLHVHGERTPAAQVGTSA